MQDANAKLSTNLIVLNRELRFCWREGVQNGKIAPQQKANILWHCDGYAYTPKGITLGGACTAERLPYNDWTLAVYSIAELVQSKKCCEVLIEYLGHAWSNHDRARDVVHNYIRRYLLILSGSDRATSLSAITRRFISQFDGHGSAHYIDNMSITGVTIEPNEIWISKNILIRKANERDLVQPEKNTEVLWMASQRATIFVSIKTKKDNELQKMAQQLLILLRIFLGASADYKSYTMNTTDLIGKTGFVNSGTVFNAPKNNGVIECKYIASTDVKKLIYFIGIFWDKLDVSNYFSAGKTITPVSVALERLNDSLFQSHLQEQRIANIVIGLEALFLIENQELGYKLRLRVGKFVSALGYDGIAAADNIKKAYDLRSAYAHGNHVPDNPLNLEIIDHVSKYLRLGIIYLVLSENDNVKGKKRFLEMLDLSFIDKKSHDLLRQELLVMKKVKII